MRMNMTILGLLALLTFPALVRAFPTDSLLLVRSFYYTAAGDTPSVTRYEYSRDNQGSWSERQSEYRHDTLYYMIYTVLDAKLHIAVDSFFVLDTTNRPIWSSETVRYDSAGRVVEATIRSSDSTSSHAEMQYNAAGDMVLYILKPDTGSAVDSIRYGYDTQDRKIDQLVIYNGIRVDRHYAYDASGRDILETTFNSKGDTSSILSIEYNAAGKRLREVSITPGDSLGLMYAETRYEYDAAGNKISMKTYGKSGAFVSGYGYEYQDITIPLGLSAIRRRSGSLENPERANAWAQSGLLRNALGRRVQVAPGAGAFFAGKETGSPGRPR